MPRQITTTVYQFDELNDKAKERARDWYREGALNDEWWDCIYEDAEKAGLKITGFDIGRGQYVEGKLIKSVAQSIEAILADHGDECGTYKLATQYKARLSLLDKDSQEYDDELDRIEQEYTEALCEEYRHMLEREYEYLLSDECVDETILVNEYEFEEDGCRARK